MNRRGAAWAIAAAAMFGVSTPFAKMILDGGRGELAMAGLLYLGGGIGLTALLAARGATEGPGLRALRRGERAWLGLATLMGGLVAPALLMYGLRRTGGMAASLLLAVETPATALLAWAFFGERFGRRVILGGALVLLGAIAVRLADTGPSTATLAGALAIVASCFGWALDNNATARIAHHDSLRIARFKCVVAAPLALALAYLFDRDGLVSAAWTPGAIAGALAVGAIGYGLSLACFVRALRAFGAARTGALFATAPFLSAVVAIPVLGETPSFTIAGAAALLAVGTWALVTEPLRDR